MHAIAEPVRGGGVQAARQKGAVGYHAGNAALLVIAAIAAARITELRIAQPRDPPSLHLVEVDGAAFQLRHETVAAAGNGAYPCPPQKDPLLRCRPIDDKCLDKGVVECTGFHAAIGNAEG